MKRALGIRALLRLAQPDARLVMVDGEAFILCRRECYRVPPVALDTLERAGWVSAPQAMSVVQCALTSRGQAVANRIEETIRSTHQLALWQFDEEEERAQASTLPLFQ